MEIDEINLCLGLCWLRGDERPCFVAYSSGAKSPLAAMACLLKMRRLYSG